MIKWIVLLLLANAYVFGQDVTIKPATKQLVAIGANFELNYPSTTDQYIVSKWAKGKLYYANSTSKKYDSLNFDRYGNAIETVINSKPLSVYPIGLAGALIYTGDNAGYVLVKATIDEAPKLLEVISAGKYVLAYSLTAIEDVESTLIKTDEFRFAPKPEAKVNVSGKFHLWDGTTWSAFRLNKHTISKLFMVEKKVLQEYISRNNINLSTNKGVIKLFQHFNYVE